MKRVVLILVSILVVLAGVLVLATTIYKDKIANALLQKANQQLNVSIGYDSYKLSLLKSFPDFTATFHQLSVIGNNAFQGDTLASADILQIQIDVLSLIKKEGVQIESIKLQHALLQLLVNENGQANWDIQKNSSAAPQVSETKASNNSTDAPLMVMLKDIELSDFDFIYRNEHDNYSFSVFDVNANLTGKMAGMNTILDVTAFTPSMNLDYDSIGYIKNSTLNIKTRLTADLANYDFRFEEGRTMLNDLPLAIKGGFSMPSDSMLFDIDFSVPEIDMKRVLSVVPQSYQKYLSEVQTTGNVTFGGFIKGIYYNEIYPAVDVKLKIDNGVVKYPELPDELLIQRLVAGITKPEGDLDSLAVGIDDLLIKVADNPFTMHAAFSHLFTDPHLDVALLGNIDLGTLAKVVPLGETKMNGLMRTDATIVGNYSALAKNDFASFVSNGTVVLEQFSLQNHIVPQGLEISRAVMELRNQDVHVKGLHGNIGSSDFIMVGNFYHVITYLFADDELSGAFKLKSNTVNANEFITKQKTIQRTGSEVYVHVNTSKVEDTPLAFPEKVHLTFDATIDHLLFDRMDITAFKGKLELKDQKLTLNNLQMNMIDGMMKMNGSVLADGRPEPDVNVEMNVIGFDLPSAYRDLSIVQKYMPFAAKSEGEFSTQMKVQSKLSNDMKMILPTLTASGSFSTKNVKLVDANFFAGLKSVIQYEKLRNPTIGDFTTQFSISDGNLRLSPFKTKVANQPVSMGGVYNLGGTLNFRVDATIEKAILSNDIKSMISYIPGHQNLKTIDVGLDITGDAKKPDVNVDAEKIKKQVFKQIKNSSKEDLEDAAKKLLRELFK